MTGSITRKTVGLIAGAMLALGGGAMAQGTAVPTTPDQNPVMKQPMQVDETGSASATKVDRGADTSVASSSTADRQELDGSLLKKSKSMLYLKHDGVVVPVRIGKSTRFTDPSLSSAKKLEEGQDVHVAIQVKNAENWATEVSLASTSSTGQGGSGLTGESKGTSVPDTGGADARPNGNVPPSITPPIPAVNPSTVHDSSSPNDSSLPSKNGQPKATTPPAP